MKSNDSRKENRYSFENAILDGRNKYESTLER